MQPRNTYIPSLLVIRNGKIQPKTPKNSDNVRYSRVLLSSRQPHITTIPQNYYQNTINTQNKQLEKIKKDYKQLEADYWNKFSQSQKIDQQEEYLNEDGTPLKNPNAILAKDISKTLSILQKVQEKQQELPNIPFPMKTGPIKYNSSEKRFHKSKFQNQPQPFNTNLKTQCQSQPADNQFETLLNNTIKQHQSLKIQFEQYRHQMQNNFMAESEKSYYERQNYQKMMQMERQNNQILKAKMKDLEKNIYEKDQLIYSLIKKIKKNNIEQYKIQNY